MGKSLAVIFISLFSFYSHANVFNCKLMIRQPLNGVDQLIGRFQRDISKLTSAGGVFETDGPLGSYRIQFNHGITSPDEIKSLSLKDNSTGVETGLGFSLGTTSLSVKPGSGLAHVTLLQTDKFLHLLCVVK